MPEQGFSTHPMRGEHLLFLTDAQLRQSIELLFFAYREFTADPDRILATRNYGRAHHRALHFINQNEGLTVNDLLGILRVTKQSLNRVLRKLMDDNLVINSIGTTDRRKRHLLLTPEGKAFTNELTQIQKRRLRYAFSRAGPEAVAGFRRVLEEMIESDDFDKLSPGTMRAAHDD